MESSQWVLIFLFSLVHRQLPTFDESAATIIYSATPDVTPALSNR